MKTILFFILVFFNVSYSQLQLSGIWDIPFGYTKEQVVTKMNDKHNGILDTEVKNKLRYNNSSFLRYNNTTLDFHFNKNNELFQVDAYIIKDDYELSTIPLYYSIKKDINKKYYNTNDTCRLMFFNTYDEILHVFEHKPYNSFMNILNIKNQNMLYKSIWSFQHNRFITLTITTDLYVLLTYKDENIYKNKQTNNDLTDY